MAIGTGNGLTLVDQIDELIDVVITAPTSGQSLVFNGQTGKWVNASAAGGGAGTVASVSAGVGLSASPNPITGTGEIFIKETAVSAGSYVLASITVNQQGQITAAANGAAGSGTVTSVSAGIGLSASPNPITGAGEIFLTDTAVSAGSYTRATITVDAQGRITTAANGALQTITLTGDVSGSGTAGITTTINPATVTNAKLANMNAFTVKSNIQSSAAVPTDNTLSVIIDAAVSGAAQGDILYRGNGSWTKLVAGTSGQFLRTLGVSANPVWADAGAGAGTVTSAGITGTDGIGVAGSPITTEGQITLSLGNITPDNITTGIVSATNVNVTGNIVGSAANLSGPLAGTTAAFSGIVSANGGLAAAALTATTGNFSGTLTGAAATFSGIVSANAGLVSTTGNFSGIVSANAGLKSTTATFSGLVSADAGINTTVVSAASINVTGDIRATTGRVLASAATLTALLTGATATFSGVVSANAGLSSTTGNFSGLLTGATATFSGLVSANAGLRATTVSASSVIGGSNLSGTNTGDVTLAGQNYLAIAGQVVSAGLIANTHLANMNAFTIKSNIKSSAASPLDNSLSAVIDAAVSGAIWGDVLYRGDGTWTKLAAGTSGQLLSTSGVSANPSWITASGTGTVTSAAIVVPVGLSAAGTPITAAGAFRITWKEPVSAAFNGTTNVDASLGSYFRGTAVSAFTLSANNAYDGQKIIWEIIQDATGGRAITLGNKFALGTDIAAVTLSTVSSKRDFLGAFYNSTTDKFYITAFVKGY